MRNALMSDLNPNSSITAQIKQGRDIPTLPYQAGLSEIDRIKYNKVISHLNQSTYSSSIETAQIFTLTDHSNPSNEPIP